MSPYRNCLRNVEDVISQKHSSRSSSFQRAKQQEAKVYFISQTSW